MDETKVKFGDKVFLYGSFLRFLPEDGDFYYDTVKGYVAINNSSVINIDAVSEQREVPGFVVDFLSLDSFTVGTAFSNVVDVTDALSRQEPTLSGTRVWMPTE